MKEQNKFYPKPKETGGRIIRKVISLMKKSGLILPLSSDILIAVSGGSDSTALSHLLIHYGRRIIDVNKTKILHINHGWRGIESKKDEAFVKNLGKKWKVPVIIRKLEFSLHKKKKESLEDKARKERKKIFELLTEKKNAFIFTAHHADDLAETMVWRFFTGAFKTHNKGILFQYQTQIRPFLTIRKSEIYSYLKEEKESFRIDETNFSTRFLRAKMRKTLMPEIEKIFPKSIYHLVALGLNEQISTNLKK